MNEHSYNLLKQCAKDCYATDSRLERAIGEIQNGSMKSRVLQSLEVADRLRRDIEQSLEHQCADACPIAKTENKEIGEDAALAKELCRNEYSQILSLGQALCRFPEAEQSAKETAYKLIAAKEQMVYHLREYL